VQNNVRTALIGGWVMCESYSNIVIYMKEYTLNKKIKDLLIKINPLLTQKENNIRIHLEALTNGLITEDEFRAIEAKMELGKLCLGLEEIIPDSYVTILFYTEEENKIYHGAAPNIPLQFFDFFHDINQRNLFNENCGSCGSAIYNKKVVVTDINTSPLWGPLREHVARYGFQTGWSLPFYKNNKVIGTFAIYHKYPGGITKKEIQLVQEKVKEYQEYIYHLSNNLVAN
jgi:hypothetical protein